MVGYYDVNSGGNQLEYGFLYDGTTYTTILPPGATTSRVTGISGGDVVGNDIIGGTQYGFLFTVPEPSGLVLLGIGVATTAGYFVRRRHRRTATAGPATPA